jgi:methionyl-tRNA formyltransferase
MRLLFMGSPEFAVPTLRSLCAAGHCIAMVVTRPDRPRGRSGKPLPTAAKSAALELGLEVFQPDSSNAPEAVAVLRAARAELGVVVAYGELLSAEVLEVATGGFINLHASLLPEYRGAAPINWAVIRGETKTGVSVIRMAPELDAGPVLAQREVDIGRDETAGELAERLAAVGADVVAEVVGRLAAGEEVQGRPQPRSRGFFARKLTKADGKVDWRLPAAEVRNRVRGLTPWPGAYCELRTEDGTERVTLLRAVTADAEAEGYAAEPGAVVRCEADGIIVQAGDGLVRIEEVKPAGGRAMAAADFARGHRVRPGDRFL